MASIKRQPNGRWRARYRDGDNVEHARHFTRKTDGQRWLDEVTADIVVGRYVDPQAGRVSFTTYYAGWAARQVWAPNTRLAMDLAARTVTFGDIPLRTVRRSHVETMVKMWDVRGLAAGTIKTRFQNVRTVLRAAVADKVIGSDPSDGVTLPRRRKAAAAMVIPTVEQVGALLSVVDPEFRAGLAVAAFAGLRLGEVCGLQVADIGFLARTLSVTRQVQRAGGTEVEIRPPKYGSERTVHLPDELVTILAQHVKRGGLQGTDWLFPSGTGGNPLHQDSAGAKWDQARRKAGVPDLHFHGLRHFYASGLIMSGCDVVTVQRALGHGSASITLDTYAHLWPTAEDRTRQAAAGLLSAALGSVAADSANLADSWRTGRAR